MNTRFSPIQVLPLAAVCFLLLFLPHAGRSGTFSTDFNSGAPSGATLFGNAFVDTSGGVGDSGVLKLTANSPNQQGAIILDDLDPGNRVGSFVATFKVLLNSTTIPGDGFSFNFGHNLSGTMGEEGSGDDLTVTFDTYNNGTDDSPEGAEFRVKKAGVPVANRKVNNAIVTGTDFADVQISWTPAGTLTLVYRGVVIFTNLFVLGPPASGSQFGLGARSGGGSQENLFIDDLNISTTLIAGFYVKGSVLPYPPVNISPDAFFQLTLQDSAAAVDPNSVSMTFDGFPVSPAVSKSGINNVTTISYGPPTLLLSNSLNHVIVTFSDSSPAINTLQYDLQVAFAPIWSLAVSNRPYLLQDPNAVSSTGTTPLWRSIAYNALSNHVIIAARTNQTGGNVNPSGLTINVLDADTGADLWQLQTNGIPGNNQGAGTFPVAYMAVADDGRVYGCNVTTTNGVVVYCWDTDSPSTTPRVVFASIIPGGNGNARWGDTFAARGSGASTELILDAQNSPTNVMLKATDSSVTGFTAALYVHTYAGTMIGRSLQFGPTNTFFLKKKAGTPQPLQLIRYDTSPTTTLLSSYPDWHVRIGELAVDLSKNIAAGIYTNSGAIPDRLLVFDISNLSAPIQIAQYNFPINHQPNVNDIGQVIIGGGKIFALEGNNGILAVPEVPPFMPHLDLAISGANAILSWSNPVPPFTLQATPTLDPTSWTSLAPVTLIGGKSYVTNSLTSSNQFYRLIKP